MQIIIKLMALGWLFGGGFTRKVTPSYIFQKIEKFVLALFEHKAIAIVRICVTLVLCQIKFPLAKFSFLESDAVFIELCVSV